MSLDSFVTQFFSTHSYAPSADELTDSSLADLTLAYRSTLTALPTIGHEVVSVEDLLFDGNHMRIYRPVLDAFKTPPPLVLFFHGGAGVAGSLDTHEQIAKQIAAQGMVVASVNWTAEGGCFDSATSQALWVLQHVRNQPTFKTAVSPNITIVGIETGAIIASVAAMAINEQLDEPKRAAGGPLNPAQVKPVMWNINGLVYIDPISVAPLAETSSLFPVSGAIRLLEDWANQGSEAPSISQKTIADAYANVAALDVPICIIAGGRSPMQPAALQLIETLEPACSQPVLGIIFDGAPADALVMNTGSIVTSVMQESTLAAIGRIAR